MGKRNRSNSWQNRRASLHSLTVATERLEPRIALKWTGVPPASVPVPGIYTSVSLDALSDAHGSAAIANKEIDYYQFQATSDGPYVISAKTPSSNLNTVLGVFSASGKRLSFNDNISSKNTDSQVAVNLKAGVTYFVGITNRSATNLTHGAYDWRIDGLWPAPPDDAYEQNDTQSTAADLGTITDPITVNKLILADSADWFKFTTLNPGLAGDSVSINFQNSRGDLDLELYSSTLGQLITRTHGVGNTETISLAGLAAGTYYVRVFGFQNALNPSYTLTVDPPATPPALNVELAGYSLKTDNDVNWGQSLAVQAQIHNYGTDAAGSFKVQWYLAKDTLGTDAILLSRTNGQGDSYTVSGVGGGKNSTTIAVSLQLPDELPIGWDDKGFESNLFFLIMKTDANNDVPGELSEKNNFGQMGGGIDNLALAFGGQTRVDSGFKIDFKFGDGVSINEQAFFKAAAHRWEQVIVGEDPDVFNGGTQMVVDDTLIDFDVSSIDGPGNILGLGGPSPLRGGTQLPLGGSITIDAGDIRLMEKDIDTLYQVALHEIGHTLGIITIRSDLIGSGTNGEPIFTGKNATKAYVDLFGLDPDPMVTPGVPLAAKDDLAHWNEAIFGDELMTPYAAATGRGIISTITIGALKDLGYSVTGAADPYTPPAPAPSAPAAPAFAGGAGIQLPPGMFGEQAAASASVASPASALSIVIAIPITIGPNNSSTPAGSSLAAKSNPAPAAAPNAAPAKLAAVDFVLSIVSSSSNYHNTSGAEPSVDDVFASESALGVDWNA